MRRLLPLLILVEIVFGVLYAANTPRWEAPDEPAQFNYTRQIAETGTLPVLSSGDYNQDYLEKIKAARFPPNLPVDSLRYESYQPPLYYLVTTPIYLAAVRSGVDPVIALRLFSVLLGAALLLLAWQVLATVFPANPLLALAGVGLMAAVPMHIALDAAVNADALAEVILAAILLVSMRRAQGALTDRGFILLGGLTYGLALLISTKDYPSVVLLLLAEWGYLWQKTETGEHRVSGDLGATTGDLASTFSGRTIQELARTLVPLLAIALALASWWFVRQALLYGPSDILGWSRHDLVVTGQPTTAAWIAQFGFKNILADFFIITFKSFWAQFGWMGVLVNDRIYVALFLLTAVALFGAVLWLARIVRERGRDLGGTTWSWVLLGAWLLVVLVAHAWYNLRYVQPQGRYLFPALIPISAVLVVGLYEVLDKRYAGIVLGLVYLALLGLDYVSLYWFIIPQLRI